MAIVQGFSVSPWAMIKGFNLREQMQLGRAIVRLVLSPARTAEVFQLAEPFLRNDARRTGAIAAYLDAVLDLPGVRASYEERYLPPVPDVNLLGQLPHGTLGRVFADHMTSNGLDVEFYPSIEAVNLLTWIERRARQQHDILHVVTGFGTDLAGELGVQAFQFAQLNTPLATALIGGGLLHASLFHPGQLHACLAAVSRGFHLGQQACPALGYRFEDMWERPMASVRAEMGAA